jgi:hypothetical protein
VLILKNKIVFSICWNNPSARVDIVAQASRERLLSRLAAFLIHWSRAWGFTGVSDQDKDRIILITK